MMLFLKVTDNIAILLLVMSVGTALENDLLAGSFVGTWHKIILVSCIGVYEVHCTAVFKLGNVSAQ